MHVQSIGTKCQYAKCQYDVVIVLRERERERERASVGKEVF